jgi:hypothetical protein
MALQRFLDAIDPYAFVDAIEDLEDKDSLPYFGATKFANKRTENKKLEFIKGYKEHSRLAPLSQLDVNPTKKGREGFSVINSEIPFIRFYKDLDEQTQDDINRAYSMAQTFKNDGIRALRDVIGEVYNDTFHLVKDVRATAEFMRMQVLQTNGLHITSVDYDNNTVKFDASFDIPGDTTWDTDHNFQASTPWEDNAAKPLEDIVEAIRKARKLNGTVIKEILPSGRLFEALLISPEVREQLSSVLGVKVDAVNIDSITSWINSKSGGSVKILNPYDYNNSAIGYDGTTTNFVNDDKIILLPAGTVGGLWHAPTPAELAKRMDPSRKVAEVDTRTSVGSYPPGNNEPIVYRTIVSARFAPSGEGMDRVFNITVPAVEA